MQGKWEAAQLEYEGMIEKEPDAPGIHFLLGRVLLSDLTLARTPRNAQARI